nr:MAG TPA: hypothetical protein [Caudoviricetes sp.]
MNHANILRATRFQILFPTQHHPAFCSDRTKRSALGRVLRRQGEGSEFLRTLQNVIAAPIAYTRVQNWQYRYHGPVATGQYGIRK